MREQKEIDLINTIVQVMLNNLSVFVRARYPSENDNGNKEETFFARDIVLNLAGNFIYEITNHKNKESFEATSGSFILDLENWFDEIKKNYMTDKETH